MFRINKKLEFFWFYPCTELREFWPHNTDLYYTKTIFLNTSVKYKNLDYRDWIFYLNGFEIIISEDELRNIRWPIYFETDSELAQIKINYPELVFNAKDNCYYSDFLQFRKTRN